jgi:ubiquinone/menaquinone biosynthesis C-methylase UbiE
MRRMVDPLQNPGYVDSEALLRLAQFIKAIKQRMVDLLRIEPRMRLLDVGCGPGTDTIDMAQLVGKEGLVIGIDYDESLIHNAYDRVRKAGVAAWTRHVVGHALAIPLSSDFFDISRSDRLFQHVKNSRRALEEMIRVTKTGGRIAVCDTDWCSLSIDTPEIDIERRITRFLPDMLHNGYAGRQLFRLFQEYNLSGVTVEVHPLVWTDWHIFHATSFSIEDLDRKLIESGTVTQEELGRFFMSLEDAHRHGAFFASASVMLVIGTKRG